MFNKNSGYGLLEAVRTHVNLPVLGKVFIVAVSTDPNYDRLAQIYDTDPTGEVRLYGTIAGAYGAAVTNRNDVILVDSSSIHSLTTSLAVTKNRIHFLGVDSGGRITNQGARIQISGNVATASVLSDIGIANTYRNIKFIQASTNAAALTVLQLGGERTAMFNCSAVFGVATNLGGITASEVLCGTDSATFQDCEFGSDTLLTSAARIVFKVIAVNGVQEFKSNRFRQCVFKISSSSATALLLKVNSIADVLFTNLFEDCTFYASVDSAGGAAITNAVASVASLVKGTLAFARPNVFFCTNFSASNSTNFQVTGPAVSSNAFEGITPA